ncbi:MAG: DUF1566 domain-containing protein [Candidatus Kapaibacterium sp.]
MVSSSLTRILPLVVTLLSCTESAEPTVVRDIGDVFGGGVIVSIAKDGSGAQHGVVVAPDELSASVSWTYGGELCAAYTGGGHDDWVLPDVSDLMSMVKNTSAINSTLSAKGDTLRTGVYWSGREFDKTDAWYVSFVNGSANSASKNQAFRIRAVRRF